ncbi:MAG TPA: MerR family transcriptional regulator [Candidatus Acidoferrales bacterium]|nr:MerR family transcriptional regulator [Candidatus Acidoferrales bacterium]
MTSHATSIEADNLDKPIYSVNVASEILESNPGTLLVYEGLGLATPKGSGRRRYSSRDMLGLTALRRLTRRHGLNITGARYVVRYLQLLDAYQLPRPMEFVNIRVEHVRL